MANNDTTLYDYFLFFFLSALFFHTQGGLREASASSQHGRAVIISIARILLYTRTILRFVTNEAFLVQEKQRYPTKMINSNFYYLITICFPIPQMWLGDSKRACIYVLPSLRCNVSGTQRSELPFGLPTFSGKNLEQNVDILGSHA